MNKFELQKISGENAHEILQKFLLKKKFSPVFFFSPYVLNTWLTHAGKDLYILTHEDDEVLIVHKVEKNDIRVLFEHPTKEIQAYIMDYFKPNYFAVNDCITHPISGSYLTSQEAEISLLPIANLIDKNVRKKYNQFTRKYPELFFEPYKPSHSELVKAFVDKWNTTRTEEKNKFAKTESDLHFVDLYKDDTAVIGGVVIKDGEVISVSLCIPGVSGGLLAVINKCLRGYSELGVFTYVERAKYLIKQGFQSVNIGAINNEFKKQFLDDAVIRDVYCYEIYKASDFESSDKYLFRIF